MRAVENHQSIGIADVDSANGIGSGTPILGASMISFRRKRAQLQCPCRRGMEGEYCADYYQQYSERRGYVSKKILQVNCSYKNLM